MGDLSGRLDEIRHPEALRSMRQRLEVKNGVGPGEPLSQAHENYMGILEDSAKLAVGAWRAARLNDAPQPVVRVEEVEAHAA